MTRDVNSILVSHFGDKVRLKRVYRKTLKPLVKLPSSLRWSLAAKGHPLCQNDSDILQLRDALRGQPIFIIGNGPSINLMNLDVLRGAYTIGSNSLCLATGQLGFEPTFYTVKDNLAAQNLKDGIESLKHSTILASVQLKQHLSTISRVRYFNFETAYPDCPLPFSRSFVRRVSCGFTVTYTNLQLAYYLGCSEAILVGVDHWYDVPEGANPGEIVRSENHPPTHFLASDKTSESKWYVPNLAGSEKSYSLARSAFESDNRQIANATIGGNLEIFRRESFENVISRLELTHASFRG